MTNNPGGQWPDDNKPYDDEDIKLLHMWSLDYKIVENQHRFAQADLVAEGKEVDLKTVLAQAGVVAPPENSEPVYFTPENPAVPSEDDDIPGQQSFDRDGMREYLDGWTVPELEKELDDRDLPKSGLKAELIERILDDAEKAWEEADLEDQSESTEQVQENDDSPEAQTGD